MKYNGIAMHPRTEACSLSACRTVGSHGVEQGKLIFWKADIFGMRQLAQPAKLHRDKSAFRRGREKCSVISMATAREKHCAR